MENLIVFDYEADLVLELDPFRNFFRDSSPVLEEQGDAAVPLRVSINNGETEFDLSDISNVFMFYGTILLLSELPKEANGQQVFKLVFEKKEDATTAMRTLQGAALDGVNATMHIDLQATAE